LQYTPRGKAREPRLLSSRRAAEMLPSREQLGPYDASLGPLGGRHGLLDDRRIIVVAICP
jgi:hypothetical protein